VSSSISVYAVSLEKLTSVVDSRDTQLVSTIAAQQANFLERVDEINDEAELSCLDALKHLVNGDELNESHGYLYGYALEALCMQLGAELPNISGISGAGEWIEKTDSMLARHQVPLSLSTLVYGGSPIQIPQPDDYPFIGSWPVREIASALSVLERIDKNALDPEMAETFGQLEGWMTAALERGSAIIGFLS
jgi:hypothetical protein